MSNIQLIFLLSYRTYKPWQLGVVLFTVGNMLNFFSFGERDMNFANAFRKSQFCQGCFVTMVFCNSPGFAAQSLLAALGSVQFVSNVFFASMVLGEKVPLMLTSPVE